MDLRLRMGSSMMVVGPSSSGKTYFILKLIDRAYEMFDVAPTNVFWCYGQKTKIHDKIVTKGYKMVKGLPEKFDFITPSSIIMLDDLMMEGANNKAASMLFIRSAHHIPCFVIFTRQNLFVKGAETRNQTLNTQYLVLFKNPMDKLQIKTLQQRMFPSSGDYLVNAFSDATKEPHSYLMIDSHQETPEIVRVRARILPHERPMVAYVDKHNYSDITTSKYKHVN
jgi:hypothetical protein